MSKRAVIAGAVSVLLLGASVAFAYAANEKPYLMTDLVGTWNCTYDGPKGHQTSTITITAIDGADNWVQYTSKDGKYGDRPAHTSFGLIGYDPKKKQYISMGGTSLPADYGIGHAPASATAKSMTFVGDYPADPTHDKTTYQVGDTKMSSADSWTEKGKAMTAKGSCTKQ